MLRRPRNESGLDELSLVEATRVGGTHTTGAPVRATHYVCPECADPGCGFVTVPVDARDDCVVWSEPAWGDAANPASAIEGPWRDLWFYRVAYHTALGLYL